MDEAKIKRLLQYLGFSDIEDLVINITKLNHNSFKSQIINKDQKVVFIFNAYRFLNQPTEWYVKIPVMLGENHEIQPLTNIDNNLITQYALIQSKYLKIFDKLHHNAIYQYPSIYLDMAIIDEYAENIQEDEFTVTDLEFRAKVIHQNIPIESISANIEGVVKRKLLESDLFNYSEDFKLTDEIVDKALLLSDMLTT